MNQQQTQRKKDKDFYTWTYRECIKDTYEWWGTDIMSQYDNICEDFPNAAEAIKKMYSPFDIEDYTDAKPLTFENPEFIYQAIANFIPAKQDLQFDTETKVLSFETDRLSTYAVVYKDTVINTGIICLLY